MATGSWDFESSDVVQDSADGDFRAGDGLESLELGCLGELHGAVQPVVVRERQRRIVQLSGCQDQLLGMGGAVQERIARVAMKLDVHLAGGWKGGMGPGGPVGGRRAGSAPGYLTRI